MQIYCIYCTVSNKYYVGRTTQDLQSRWYNHVWDALHGKKFHLHNAIRKYGPSAFTIWSLPGDSNLHERLWILALRSYDPEIGYNMTLGGDGGGIPTEETRAKMKGRQHMLGKKFSPESLERARIGHTGILHTVATREKLSIIRKGRPWTEARRRAQEARRS